VGDFRIDRCVIYATNITPDKETGIGNYTLAEFDNAVRRGVTRDGRRLYPAMPYPSYATMMDAFNNSTQFMSHEDLTAIARYLKTLSDRGGVEGVFVHDDKTEIALNKGDLSAPGSSLYLKNCVFCHGRAGRGHGTFQPPLAGNPTILDDDPSSVINVILNGAGRIVAGGVPDSYRMPPSRVLLSDKDIAEERRGMSCLS
jgi:mono/diheme cytochrome c family protein